MNDEKLLRELADLRQQVTGLDTALRELRRSQRTRARSRWVGVAALVTGTAAFAQLTVFSANSPAIASEVNANFTQLKTWLEQKVGVVGTATVTTGSVTANTAAVTTSMTVPRLTVGSPSGNALQITGNSAAGNLHLDAQSNSTFLNFFSGTGGVNFGNGFQTVVASVNAGGVLAASSINPATVIPGSVRGGGVTQCNATSATQLGCTAFGSATCGAVGSACNTFSCSRGTLRSLSMTNACYNASQTAYCFSWICVE